MVAKRRVLSIATLFPNSVKPRFGTFVARQFEALAAQGKWDVTVINPIGIPPLVFGRYRPLLDVLGAAEENGVHVHRERFTLIPAFGARRNPAAIAKAILPLAKALHEQHPFDLLDAQFFYPDGPAAAAIARALNLPLSIKARGADIHLWGAKPWANRQMRAAAEQAGGLLSVSKALADDMAAIGLPADKITLHYTGLDRTRFHPLGRQTARIALATDFGLRIGPSRSLIACIGALVPRKGQQIVIRAIARLPGVELALVGEGPDEAMLRNHAQKLGVADRVHFLGSIDHDRLPILLCSASAMVLPSESEGLANAWVEALACGTPLVICDAGGAREVVRDKTAGRIVDRNSAAIAEAVLELIAAPAPPLVVAANAERFSWKENAAALGEYYEGLLDA